MKNLVVLFLLSIFLFHSVGFSLLFESAEQMNKTLVKETLSARKLETITLSKTEYSSLVADKNEITWNGKFYDVASVQFSDDKVFIKCFHDENEENIFGMLSEHIERYVKDASSHSKNKSNTLLKSFIKDYLPLISLDLKLNIATLSSDYIVTSEAKKLSGNIEILAPPPQALV